MHTDGIAQMSYFIGDDRSGEAWVIDPRPDCKIYLQYARQYGLAITRAFETHVHADFMSGSRELRALIPSLDICVSGISDPHYGYECSRIADGDVFEIGETALTVRHTPGHTPEHIAIEIAKRSSPQQPWAVFTGDSLFVGSAGRPDLLGAGHTGELTSQLFRTLNEYYLSLADDVMILPCHGAGSACGAGIGDRHLSTIGQERQSNPFLQFDDEDAFAAFVKKGAPPIPAHYPRLKKVNLKPGSQGHAPPCPAMTVEALCRAIEGDGSATLLDTRDMLAFGGGHISGAINIGDRPELSPWSGDMLDPDQPIVIVAYDDSQIEMIVNRMWRVGFTTFKGYLAGGMKSWLATGQPLATIPQIDVHTLHDQLDDVQVLDVRSDIEWGSGHIRGAVHHYVATLRDGIDGLDMLDPKKEVVVYCGSGYRASIAASILRRNGFQHVHNLAGSMGAWRAAGLPVVT